MKLPDSMFNPSGLPFVVFRRDAGNQAPQIAAKNCDEFKPAAEISRPWQVSFDPKWGGPAGRYTFTGWRPWKKDDPLVESGLLGRVTIQATEK